MKRHLNKNIAWDKESVKVQLLDWENNPDDFNYLCNYVANDLRKQFLQDRVSLESILPDETFRHLVRLAAASYEDKHIFLGTHVYLLVKCYMLQTRQKSKRRPKWSPKRGHALAWAVKREKDFVA